MYKYFTGRINKVYERLDETKDKMQSKEICRVIHDNSFNNLTSTELRINSRFDKLEKSMEAMMNRMFDNMVKK